MNENLLRKVRDMPGLCSYQEIKEVLGFLKKFRFDWEMFRSVYIEPSGHFVDATISHIEWYLKLKEDEEGIYESADIYSPYGTKLMYMGKGGWDSDLKHADKYLSVGQTYTLNSADIGGWSTKFYLNEFPNIRFNSVHFKVV